MTSTYDDIYLEPGGGIKTNEHICDPKTLQPIPYITKQDKYVAMKLAGVKQSPLAEWNKGSRNNEFNRKHYFEVS